MAAFYKIPMRRTAAYAGMTIDAGMTIGGDDYWRG